MHARILILAGAIAGATILPSVPQWDTSPAITEAIARQTAAAAARVDAYHAAGAIYGPVTCPNGRCVDAFVVVDGRAVQLEYLNCLPALRAGTARYWEDGSVSC